MEVRPGFKLSEVGTIPNDWKIDSVINISSKILDYRGRTPKKLGMEWGGGDIPALSAGNVKMGFVDFDKECSFGSEELYNRWMTQGDVSKDDILFTTEAPLGNVALVPDNRKYILSQRTIALKVDQIRASSHYLYHMLSSIFFQRILADYSSGSTAKGIQRRKFEQLNIALPPLPEQRAIAEVLSDMDALLESLDQLIAKKRDLKQAAMQQLLTGKTRLPGFSGEWGVKKLGEIGYTYGGLTGKSKADFGIGTGRYITFLNVLSNVVIDNSLHDRVNLSSSEIQNIVTKGDLLFNGSSETPEEVAMCSYMAEEIPNLYLNSFCFGFRIKDNTNSNGLFLSYYLRASPGRNLIKSLAQGSTRYNLSKSAFLEATIRLPNREEQNAIAEVLSDLDAELKTMEEHRDKTRDLKQAMMQELLTGKTRLVPTGGAHA